MARCSWAGNDPLMVAYHEKERGTPVHDDRKLFEFLILEGAQAGLSWSTILKKRTDYRKAFDRFNPTKIASYSDKDEKKLLENAGIVRNRPKIASTISNARAFLEIKQEFGTFDAYVWQFTRGKTIQNRWRRLSQIPAQTDESDLMSKDLKKRGFRFVGSTICYAFMQAVGMVNDHTVDCFRYNELKS